MFYDVVDNYCQDKDLSYRQFERMCGLANGSVNKWKEGTDPSLRTVAKIVRATGIPLARWVENV